MRTLIDIPERQIDELSAICADRKLSRAEVVRQAIDAFIECNRPSREAAFGLWRTRPGKPGGASARAKALPVDGLAYQERLRSEW